MSEQSFKSIQEEITLKDITNSLVESWKTLAITGVSGLLASAGYLLVTPNQYQATAQIRVAQISMNNNTSPLGINIEEPKLLLTRLKLPTTYTEQEIKDCGLSDQPQYAQSIPALAKFSEVKGVESIIELKVNRPTKEVANACAESLFKNIQTSQSMLIKPYTDEAEKLLVKYQERLNYVQHLVVRADKSGAALSAVYLANRDEIKFLSDEISRLNNLITSAEMRQTKLIAPIHTSDHPVFPKKQNSMVIGLIAGIFLGLAFILVKRTSEWHRSA